MMVSYDWMLLLAAEIINEFSTCRLFRKTRINLRSSNHRRKFFHNIFLLSLLFSNKSSFDPLCRYLSSWYCNRKLNDYNLYNLLYSGFSMHPTDSNCETVNKMIYFPYYGISAVKQINWFIHESTFGFNKKNFTHSWKYKNVSICIFRTRRKTFICSQ